MTATRLAAPFHLYASKTAMFTPNIGLASFSTICRDIFAPRRAKRIVFGFCDYKTARLLVGNRRMGGFAGGRKNEKRTCTVRTRTNGPCSVRVHFRCFDKSTRLGFSLKFGRRIGVGGAMTGIGSTSMIVFTNNVSPDLRKRRVNIGLPKFHGKSHASVRLPTIRHRLVGTLYSTKGGIVFIGFSKSPVTVRPRAGCYRTVLRT